MVVISYSDNYGAICNVRCLFRCRQDRKTGHFHETGRCATVAVLLAAIAAYFS